MKKLFILAFCVALGLAVYAPSASAAVKPRPTNPVFTPPTTTPVQPVQSAR